MSASEAFLRAIQQRIPEPKRTTCKVEGCPRPLHSKDMCNVHYIRVRTHGDAHTVLPSRTPKPKPQPSPERRPTNLPTITRPKGKHVSHCPQGAHRWRIAEPEGPTSPGVCGLCGAQREFQNSFSEHDYLTTWRGE